MELSEGSTPFWAAMDPSLQNLLHIPMFLVFVFLFHMAYPIVLARRSTGMVLVLGAGALLAVLTEAIQILVPGRYPSLGDITLNLVGAALGGLILLRLRNRRVAEPKQEDS